jgi:hypothetical protein
MLKIFFTLLLVLLHFNPVDAGVRKNNTGVDGIHWKHSTVLKPTERQPARTAILIIAPPHIGKSNVELRWQLGKRVWEQYMNTHPDIDCYFIQSACFKKDSSEVAWIEGNTIYVGDSWFERERNDRILNKTVKALELLLPNYTHFFRTNINTFFNLKNLNEYAETHHQSMFTTPLWQGEWYAVGYSILFTQDVAAHMCDEYERLESAGEELISCYHSDDAAITALCTGVWPYGKPHPFRCCPSLIPGLRQLMSEDSYNTPRFARYGVLMTSVNSLQEAISACDQASPDVILYRTRDGLSVEQFAKLYEHLLQKYYPELPAIDLVEYINSFR